MLLLHELASCSVLLFICALPFATGNGVGDFDDNIFDDEIPFWRSSLADLTNARSARQKRQSPPFLLGLHIPSTAKVGETLLIEVTAQNQMSSNSPISFRINTNTKFELLSNRTQQLCVPPNDKNGTTFRVRGVEVGEAPISVIATFGEFDGCTPRFSITSRSTSRGSINFELPGFSREKTMTQYMCDGDDATVWSLAPEETAVENSTSARITATGDLLGIALQNTDDLIQMPYGCGEQNLIFLTPYTYVWQYLNETNQITRALRRKLRPIMRNGYAQQLEYKQSDGSYSTFGNKDTNGSTWLTAFVLKSFAKAASYIALDKQEINSTMTWLKELLNGTTGCYESVGSGIHDRVKGDTSALTAFVMIALLEAGEPSNSSAITCARDCINTDTDKDDSAGTNDLYTIALKAYAFGLAGYPQAAGAAGYLLQKLTQDSNNNLFFNISDSDDQELPDSALTVEGTSYGLLTLLTVYGPEFYPLSLRIVKFLASKMNSHGGFISSQDTVLAIEALALFQAQYPQPTLSLTATVTGSGIDETFEVTSSNRLETLQVDVSEVPNEITVAVAGDGCAVIQAVVRYTSESPQESTALSLNVTTELLGCRNSSFSACVTYTLGDMESNMAIIEVNLVTGYVPETEDLEAIISDGQNSIKLYEIDGSKVIFYSEGLTDSETCIQFTVHRLTLVEDAKNGTVVVYDYYEPEIYVSETFAFEAEPACT